MAQKIAYQPAVLAGVLRPLPIRHPARPERLPRRRPYNPRLAKTLARPAREWLCPKSLPSREASPVPSRFSQASGSESFSQSFSVRPFQKNAPTRALWGGLRVIKMGEMTGKTKIRRAIFRAVRAEARAQAPPLADCANPTAQPQEPPARAHLDSARDGGDDAGQGDLPALFP